MATDGVRNGRLSMLDALEISGCPSRIRHKSDYVPPMSNATASG
jgi:hypothetical protein